MTLQYGNRIKKIAQKGEFLNDIRALTLDEVFEVLSSKFPNNRKEWSPTKTMEDFIDNHPDLYNKALKMPLESIACYVDKDQLLDDKLEEEVSNGTGSKLSPLNHHLNKIEHCIRLYMNKEYNEFMRSSSIKQIVKAGQKKELREGIERIVTSCNSMTISDVIDLANVLGICVKDEKVTSYIENHPYLWSRIKEVKYQEAKNVYDYRMGNKPFSTQHKTKGLEYNNVLVILKSNWSNYDFASLFCDNNKKESIVKRTKKLFYVCCTRAKENLVVYYPSASLDVIKGAKNLFGEKNTYSL